jgi:hypothetical protein
MRPFQLVSLVAALPIVAAEPFRIEVVDRENGWPVPLVELRTTHDAMFVTDNSGLVAIDAPELMEREVYFHVKSHGYGVKPDGFGYRGVRVTPTPGGTFRVEVDRGMVAKRLGRLTGAGRFAEAEKLGEMAPSAETGVFGCDSIQVARHRDRLFWFWGDTNVARYPLGVFHMTGASTDLAPLTSFQPPLAMNYEYYQDKDGHPAALANFPGAGPTWLGGIFSLPASDGTFRLVASYAKIRNYLEEYETGLCVWDDGRERFEIQKVLWNADRDGAKKINAPLGHPFLYQHPGEDEFLYYGDPFPVLRMPPTFEGWSEPENWERIAPLASLRSAEDDSEVIPHRGSVTWNPFRKRWISIFTQTSGKPSALGEIWYAEAQSPLGPWGPTVKVLTHDNYTFYNPRIHSELTDPDASFIVFEGTYTAEFANRAVPTPKYNYNQILYRLDLDDPALVPARE